MPTCNSPHQVPPSLFSMACKVELDLEIGIIRIYGLWRASCSSEWMYLWWHCWMSVWSSNLLPASTPSRLRRGYLDQQVCTAKYLVQLGHLQEDARQSRLHSSTVFSQPTSPNLLAPLSYCLDTSQLNQVSSGVEVILERLLQLRPPQIAVPLLYGNTLVVHATYCICETKKPREEWACPWRG